MAHIDIHKTKDRYNRQKHFILESKELSEHNKRIIMKFLHDAELGKTIRHRQKTKIGEGRCLKLGMNLRQICKWLGDTPLDNVTPEQMEDFIYKLESDSILNKYGCKFKESSKRDIKKTIKKMIRS